MDGYNIVGGYDIVGFRKSLKRFLIRNLRRGLKSLKSIKVEVRLEPTIGTNSRIRNKFI